MRATDSWLYRVDEWRREQPGRPSRAEAIRRLVELGLESKVPSSPPALAELDYWNRNISDRRVQRGHRSGRLCSSFRRRNWDFGATLWSMVVGLRSVFQL